MVTTNALDGKKAAGEMALHFALRLNTPAPTMFFSKFTDETRMLAVPDPEDFVGAFVRSITAVALCCSWKIFRERNAPPPTPLPPSDSRLAVRRASLPGTRATTKGTTAIRNADRRSLLPKTIFFNSPNKNWLKLLLPRNDATHDFIQYQDNLTTLVCLIHRGFAFSRVFPQNFHN